MLRQQESGFSSAEEPKYPFPQMLYLTRKGDKHLTSGQVTELLRLRAPFYPEGPLFTLKKPY